MKASTVLTNHDAVEPEAMGYSEKGHHISLRAGWTDERVELLTKLWTEGKSCSQIAAQLGNVTRNAVIGKVCRLGLQKRANPSKPRSPDGVTVRKRSSGIGGGTRYSARLRAPEVKRDPHQNAGLAFGTRTFSPKIEAMAGEPAPVTARPWLERRFGQCAYPVSGSGAHTFSCCAPVWESRRYCKAHAKIMYQATRTEAQREGDRKRSETMRARSRWAA